MPTKLQELLQENCYVDKLERWLALFPADRFILIKSEDLRDEGKRPHILDEVTEFLGAGPHAYAPEALNFLGNYRRASNTTVSPCSPRRSMSRTSPWRTMIWVPLSSTMAYTGRPPGLENRT